MWLVNLRPERVRRKGQGRWRGRTRGGREDETRRRNDIAIWGTDCWSSVKRSSAEAHVFRIRVALPMTRQQQQAAALRPAICGVVTACRMLWTRLWKRVMVRGCEGHGNRYFSSPGEKKPERERQKNGKISRGVSQGRERQGADGGRCPNVGGVLVTHVGVICCVLKRSWPEVRMGVLPRAGRQTLEGRVG